MLSQQFFLSDSIVAIAAAEKSNETIWFIKIVDEGIVASDTMKDNYGNIAIAGH